MRTLMIIVLFVLGGCSRKGVTNQTVTAIQNVKGMDLNAKRSELGLIEIRADWVLYQATEKEEHWHSSPIGAAGKSIFFGTSGQPMTEQDHAYSGRTVTVDSETGVETVTLTFHYETNLAELDYFGIDPFANAVLAEFRENHCNVTAGRPFSTSNILQAVSTMKIIARDWRDIPWQVAGTID